MLTRTDYQAGQCVTSKDCASRVPYCSKLGFCHGGRWVENSYSAGSVTILDCRLPFDEAQLEIPDNDKTDPFEKQPQGFINNNPAKNNPNAKPKAKSGGGAKDRGARRQQAGGGGRNTAAASGGGRRQQQRQQQQQGRKQGAKGGAKRRPAGGSGGGNCPGGDVASCVAACEEVARVEAFTVCVKTCGNRC